MQELKKNTLRVTVLPSQMDGKALAVRFNYDDGCGYLDAERIIEKVIVGDKSIETDQHPACNSMARWFIYHFKSRDQFQEALIALEKEHIFTFQRPNGPETRVASFVLEPPRRLLMEQASQVISNGGIGLSA